MPSVELIIDGVPVSAQAKNRQLKARYRSRVEAAARNAMGSMNVFEDPVDLSLWIFSVGGVQYPDGDNVLKPIQDALQGIVYVNDKQVHDHSVSRRSTHEPFVIPNAPRLVVEKLIDGMPFVYAHVTTDIVREVIGR